MTSTSAVRLAWRLAAIAAAVIGGALQDGCNIAGPIAYATQPEQKVPAAFELADRPTVVFVDDREGKLVPVGLRDVIAEKVSEDLMVQNIVTTAIRPRDALALARSHDRNSNLLPIDAIGRAVGAEQVIYVEIESFSESVDNYQPKPVAVAHVKVIDAVEQTRLFPPDDQSSFDFHVVNSALGEVDPTLYRSPSTRRVIREMMARQLGGDIGRVFYEHVPADRLGQRLEPK